MEDIPLYIFIFIALYSQVFLLLVLFEEWDTIFSSNKEKKLTRFPKVVIAVPCWNEEKTVERTIQSLLALDYPTDKLTVWAVDDGSKDNTWQVLQDCKQKYDKNNQLVIRTKENGGKHTVLNYVLENTQCEVFGCLDADSFVFPDTLKNMLLHFEDQEVMAATPMMIVRKPVNLLQAMQTVEYNFGLVVKRILGAIGGIHVTPGPFSLFRKEVFDKLGGYKPAHNTEDMEITFRMQRNHMKIVSAVDAYVETSTPPTVYKLYKQRLRWTQGFLLNTIDYRELLFKPKYGSVGMFTIPLGLIGIFVVVYLFFFYIYHLFYTLYHIFIRYQVIGLDFGSMNLPKFVHNLTNQLYLETNTVLLLSIPLLLASFYFMLIGHSLSKPESRNLRYIVYFVIAWGFLVPFWITRAVWNVITRNRGSWR